MMKPKGVLLSILTCSLIGLTTKNTYAQSNDLNRAESRDSAETALQSADNKNRKVLKKMQKFVRQMGYKPRSNRRLRTATRGGMSMPSGDLCALAFIPGPSQSFKIRLGLSNLVNKEVDTLVVGGFRSLGGASLLFESVFNFTPPQGGNLSLEYPSLSSGKGPVVIAFSGFNFLDGTVMSLDPDTYNDPSFGASVGNMTNTVLEIYYEEGLRCSGKLVYNPAQNASIALLSRTFP